MKVTFIQPAVGKKPDTEYARTWSMEPLAIAVLSSLTPAHIEKAFYDDRMESIPFDEPTDIAAITVETYTAKRAYDIATEYRSRKITVVMGGFHPTLATDEVKRYADVVVAGEAENSWPQVLQDFEKGTLQAEYRSRSFPEIRGVMPDRSIFNGKKYLPVGLVEASRGCYYHCEFCSIYGFYDRSYRVRPAADIAADIVHSGKKFFFIVDDNVAMDRNRTIEMCRAIKPLGIKWFGQVGIHISNDDELLLALKESGCIGVLIGFESFSESNLKQMKKNINLQYADYRKAILKLKRHGLMIYGTFLFGYADDREEDFKRVLRFSKENNLFMTAFNHLVPFPGTPMFRRFKEEGRLIDEKWWLMDDYKFGDVVFHPGHLSAEELTRLCYEYRRKFYEVRSIIGRGIDLKANCGSLKKALVYFLSNFSARSDVEFRQGLPVGHNDK
ncbi:MAG: radical SAM protein [Bacteroidales bacterium]